MASVPKNYSSANDSKPIHDPANAPLFDYIHQSAKTIQRTELTVGILSWLVGGLVTILAFVLIDQWVWQFNGFSRYAVWLFLIGGSVFWLFRRVVPYLGSSINPEYAAKRIESTIPEMKEGLISWLQLASRESTSRGVLNTVGRYVAKHLQGQEVASVIDQFTLMKLAATLFGLILIGAIYLAVTPKNGVATISRLLMPWANISPSTRVQILNVSPGDAAVTEGSNLRIAIQVRGWIRSDVTQIRFATEDGQSGDKTVPMVSEIEGLTYTADLGKGIGGILQPMKYFVEAGDAKAGPFSIKIQAVPLVLLEQVEYTYPPYMRLAPRTTEGDGRIEAPEGTRVTIRARSNQLMKKSRIELDKRPSKDNSFKVTSVDDVVIDNRSISAELLLELDEAKSNPTLLQYRIVAENGLGAENAEPIVYPIKVIPDLAPEVQLASGLKDSIELPINQKLNLEVRANDPDFGLVRLAISATSNHQNVVAKELFQNEVGANGLVSEIYILDPQTLRTPVGTQLDLVATAQDNRRAIGSDQPEPNVRQSRTIRVTITAPNPNAPDAKANKAGAETKSPSDSKEAKPDKEKAGNSSQDNQRSMSDEASKNDDKSPKNDDKASKNDPSSKDDDPSKSGKQENKDAPQSPDPSKKDEPDKTNQSNDSKSDKGSKADPAEPSKGDPKDSAKENKQDHEKSGGASDQNKQEQGKSKQEKQQSDSSKNGESKQGQTGAGESGAGQSGAEEKSGGQSSESGDAGSDSPSSQGNEPGKSNSGNKSKSRGDGASPSGDPKHDGDTFEELNDILKENAESGDASGAGKSTKSESDQKSSDRESAPNESTSGEGTPSDTDKSNRSSKSNDQKPDGNGKPSTDPSNSIDSKSNNEKSSDPKNSSSESGDKNNNPSSNERSSTTDSSPQQSPARDAEGNQASADKQSPQNQDGITKPPGKGEPSETQGSGKEPKGSEVGEPSGQKNPSSANKEKESKSGSGTDGTQESQNSEQAGTSKSEKSDGKKTGSPNGEKGDSKQGSKSQSESGKTTNGQKESKSSGPDGMDGKQTNASESGKPSSSNAGKSGTNSTGNQSGKSAPGGDKPFDENSASEQVGAPESIAAETEYARQATDMVLKALDRQRDQPDPELLKRMGWSKEQMQAFLDRWKNARDQAASDPKKKREYDEALRSLGLIPSTGKAKTAKGQDDTLRGLNEEGSRVRPPESLRERFESFRKSTIPK